jgi:hypothetical protein
VLLALGCFILSAGALGLSLHMSEAQAKDCPLTSSESLELTLDRVEFNGEPLKNIKTWGARRARVISVVDNTSTEPQRSLACFEIVDSDDVAQRRCFEQAVKQ